MELQYFTFFQKPPQHLELLHLIALVLVVNTTVFQLREPSKPDFRSHSISEG